jgi:nucleoside-triphosphatase THEP1
LVDQARLVGLAVDGLLSPAVFDSGVKVGIDLVAIATGARRRLAERRVGVGPQRLSGPHTTGWQFDGDVLDWGNAWLRRLPALDLLILDELGPIEILESQGLSAGLDRIDQRKYRLACVVVRPMLLGACQERWPWRRVLDLSGSSLP